MEELIKLNSVTKDYGGNKGVFDTSFSIMRGEAFGFLGPNGAGKTTTIRMILGFISPDAGKVSVAGYDAFSDRHHIMKNVGYLPAEINLFPSMSGNDFLDFMANLRGLSDLSYRNQLLALFDMDASVKLKRMSKGMKQKIAIVAAFMNRPDLFVLDEPTSGLDPLMQHRFNELILQEKQRGATFLLSSHNFDEVERTCDRIAIIKSGKIMAVDNIDVLKRNKLHQFTLTFSDALAVTDFISHTNYRIVSQSDAQLTLTVDGDINDFLKDLPDKKIINLQSDKLSLEELFMQYYQ